MTNSKKVLLLVLFIVFFSFNMCFAIDENQLLTTGEQNNANTSTSTYQSGDNTVSDSTSNQVDSFSSQSTYIDESASQPASQASTTVSSVSTVSNTSTVTNILNIALIVVGVLLILLAIAILIRLH